MRNRVRIIGGMWRSRRIAFPPRKDLRPTPDRVRETLFNWLGQDLTGRTCLDVLRIANSGGRWSNLFAISSHPQPKEFYLDKEKPIP